jgi:hypothetical protein
VLKLQKVYSTRTILVAQKVYSTRTILVALKPLCLQKKDQNDDRLTS